MVTLYSTNCPKCKVLEMKLKQKNIEFNTITDIQEMSALGIKSAPTLKLDDDNILDFSKAIKWVNEQ